MQILTSPLSERSIHCTQPSGMDVAGDPSCLDFDKRKCKMQWISMSQHSLAKWQATHLLQWHPLPLLPLLSPSWWHYFSKAWRLRWWKMYFDHASIAVTAAGPPLSWRTPTLLHQSWPLLVQDGSREWAMATAHHVPSARIFQKPQTTTLKSFQCWFMRFVVRSSNTFCVNFLQDVLRRKALEPGLVCKQP